MPLARSSEHFHIKDVGTHSSPPRSVVQCKEIVHLFEESLAWPYTSQRFIYQVTGGGGGGQAFCKKFKKSQFEVSMCPVMLYRVMLLNGISVLYRYIKKRVLCAMLSLVWWWNKTLLRCIKSSLFSCTFWYIHIYPQIDYGNVGVARSTLHVFVTNEVHK